MATVEVTTNNIIPIKIVILHLSILNDVNLYVPPYAVSELLNRCLVKLLVIDTSSQDMLSIFLVTG